ncbi:ATP-binding cassette long-chain fatty acid transporter pxa1 [Coemansia sp. RSA 1365]|nr:ATP-binding cassette long-chain fatty acid transporter pxa1 [Coemansia sp. RSA 1365]
MPAVNSKPTRAGLPGQALGAAAAVSLALVAYSYTQHRRTAEKAKRSMAALGTALSTASIRNLRGGAYGSGQWTEADEREQKFDADAPYFEAETAVTENGQKVTGRLDGVFLRQLRGVLRIILPALGIKEVAIMAMQALFLVLRTWLSVVVAELDGKIVKHLVRGQGRRFLAGLLSWFAIAIPATYTNSMIRFLETKLALAFRTRLTQYVHDLYLHDNLSYYRLQALGGRVANPDQFITADIARFSTRLAALLSSLGKPTLDAVIFNIQLVRGVGLRGTVGMFAMYVATAALLRACTPAFGRMAAARARLEGEFRAHHSRVIASAEEIAFYRGEQREAEQLQGSLARLVAQARGVARRKIGHVVLEDMVIKYTWSAFGYLVCAVPFFLNAGNGGGGGSSSGQRTQRFVTNKRILVNLSDAGGRMMYAIKEVMELAGHTGRVHTLLSALHALRRGGRGAVYEDIDGVRMTHVPIVAPDGELLVQPLTWNVRRGEHWMVAGPNGVGKSAVLRVLSGLWPVVAGAVERPDPAEIMYIPQRAYLPLGTLRDQVIYPHTHAQMLALGRTDEELLEVLHAVHLAYLSPREGGFSARKEWRDVLSGGEKQRINLARLFYHLPRFAVLDECTSAVSADVEGLIYEHAKRLGITLITISHRPALYKYHSFLLRLGVDHADVSARSDGQDSSSSESQNSLPTASTESWVSDVGDSSVDDNASSGVQWDVVRLPPAAESPAVELKAAEPSAMDSPPLAHTVIESRTPLPTRHLGPSSASTSRIDVARESLAQANWREIERLREMLAANKARAPALQARLAQVQHELMAVAL